MSKVVDKVYPLVEKYALTCGVDVMDIEYAKKNNGYNLTIYINKKGGVGIEDCVKLHKLIDGPLDELNPTNDENYILNVSSWSAGKILRTEKEFLSAVGKKVEIRLYESIDNQKTIIAELLDYDKENVTIKKDDGTINKIDNTKVASIVIIFEDEGE